MFLKSSRPLSINNYSGVPRFPDKNPGEPVSLQKTVIFLCHACIDYNLAYGKTNAGRFLLVVLIIANRKKRIITARDMTDREKKFYRRKK